VNIHWIHCIETFFTVQHFWTTCTCPEKQSFPWKFSLYWLYTFYHPGFLSSLPLSWKNRFDLKFFTVLKYFLSFRIFEQLMFAVKLFTVLNILFTFKIFEQLAFALKNRVCLEFTYWIHISYHSGYLSNLRLRWNTELPWNFSLFWNIFYYSGILGNLRLSWKQNLPGKLSSRGAVAHPPASYAYGPMVYRGWKTLYFILLGKWQFQNGMNKPCVHWMDSACLVKNERLLLLQKRSLRTGNQIDS